jgi:hypothetical protein
MEKIVSLAQPTKVKVKNYTPWPSLKEWRE